MSLQQFLELADSREVFNFKLGLGAPALPNFGGSLQLMHTRLDLQQADELSRRRPTSETSCLSVCLSVCLFWYRHVQCNVGVLCVFRKTSLWRYSPEWNQQPIACNLPHCEYCMVHHRPGLTLHAYQWSRDAV